MNDEIPPKIERFRFGQVVIDGRVFRHDLIVFPHGVVEGWSRSDSHMLSSHDLDPILEIPPQTLIIGTGVFRSMKVPGEALNRAKAEAIEVLVLASPKACSEYNRRCMRERTVLAIHLTC